ncbi:MAG TPA: N-methyl-L-tryptophan oxidase, partial [Puia sp.]|nr:N-methyl-L-tryptophan oxidase [Puia sp.]
GSAALYHLARTGKKVVGIDRFAPPHNRGSSHGESRIVREAYHENPVYVPFIRAAYALWEDLQREAGRPLLLETGGLLLGAADTKVVSGARLSAETYGIAYEWLDAADIPRRFPAFRPAEGTVAVWEKRAGILFPEECIQAHLAGAAARGAAIRCEEAVLGISRSGDGVEVRTSKGRYVAGKVVVSAGAWARDLLPELGLPLRVARQVVCWFRDGDTERAAGGGLGGGSGPGPRVRAADGNILGPDRMPVYIWEYDAGRMFYGFPDLGKGIKIGFHHGGREIRPEELRQDAGADEIAAIKEIAATYLSMDPQFAGASVCMYTNTPDEDFIIDEYPGWPQVLVLSPCSGHGFKFSSVVGKIACDWAIGEQIGFDLRPFGLRRFG